MPIVADFGPDAQEYIIKSKQENAPRPERCPHCGVNGSLIGHGYYWRKPRDQLRVYRLKVKRWQCKECKRTVSVLPNFLLSYRHYLLEVIAAILALRLESLASWAVILASNASEGYPALRTIQRWCGSFWNQADRWLKAVQELLARQDSRSSWLDAQGEALQRSNPAQALLAASEHLLAWAKTQWTELADYGLNKRVHFLWLWGANGGLGRLV